MEHKFEAIPSGASNRRLIPSKLREARVAARLNQTELAAAVGVTRQSISQYEQGQTIPDPLVLGRIASELGQPLGYFTSDSPSEFGQSSSHFFRAFGPDTKRRNLACQVFGAWLAQIAAYFDQFVNYPLVDVPASTPPASSDGRYSFEEIQDQASECRRAWGLGLGPISDVVALLETKGIFTCRYTITDETINAFSFWNGPRPVIFLASEPGSASRARFDAAHELGHLILHRWIAPDDLENKKVLQAIEHEADLFAGAFLLPKESFLADLFSTKLDAFVTLKSRWKVSVQAMIYRCWLLGTIDDEQRLNLFKTVSFRKWRKCEPLDDSIPIEQPQLLSRALTLVLSSGKRTADDVALALQVNRSIVERLCNVPTGTLASATKIAEFRPTLKGEKDRPHTFEVTTWLDWLSACRCAGCYSHPWRPLKSQRSSTSDRVP